MKSVSTAELRKNIAKVLRFVMHGTAFEVTRYGRVVATIVPVKRRS